MIDNRLARQTAAEACLLDYAKYHVLPQVKTQPGTGFVLLLGLQESGGWVVSLHRRRNGVIALESEVAYCSDPFRIEVEHCGTGTQAVDHLSRAKEHLAAVVSMAVGQFDHVPEAAELYDEVVS